MSKVHTVNTITYFAVTTDLTYCQYDTFQQALAVDHQFIICQKEGVNPYKAINGDVYGNYASILEILGDDEEIIEFISENDWKFSFSHFGMSHGYHFTHMSINFTDKFGLSNSREKFDISIEGFIEAYKRFLELNNYDGYKYATIAIENLKLKSELSNANDRITVLNNENIRLRNILSSVS